MKSEYRKFTDQVAADAAISSIAVNPFAWLAGDWIWRAQPVSFALTPYGLSLATDPYLIHHAVSGMWILVLSDPAAFGILIGPPIRHGQVTFTGDVTIDGQSAQLRQTWRILDANTVEIQNDRRKGNRWLLWDLSLLERVKPSN